MSYRDYKCGAGGPGQHRYQFRDYCGVKVCDGRDVHEGLIRCYCGWSTTGGNGYRELLEMGEIIEPED